MINNSHGTNTFQFLRGQSAIDRAAHKNVDGLVKKSGHGTSQHKGLLPSMQLSAQGLQHLLESRWA